MTRYLPALLFLMVLVSGCTRTSQCSRCCGSMHERITKDISKVMDQSAVDWTNDDLDGFMRSFHDSPELTFAIPTGITKGWGPLKERYARSIEKSSLWFTDIEVTVLTPDSALVFARFHNEMDEDKSYSTGLTTLLMRKIDGRWVIVHDHSSGLPKDTPRKDPPR